MKALKNRYALITGGSNGIGKEIAYCLAGKGTHLMLIGRDETSLKKIKADLYNQVKVDYYQVDFNAEHQLSEFFKYALHIGFEPDIIIHSAGYFSHSDIENISEEELNITYNINFKAPVLITRNFLQHIIKNKGDIIFINSTSSINPKAKSAVYSASKSALKTFAEVLHKEIHPLGVRVHSFFLGRVNTNMQILAANLEGLNHEPDKYLDPKEIANIVAANLELSSGIVISDVIIRPSL